MINYHNFENIINVCINIMRIIMKITTEIVIEINMKMSIEIMKMIVVNKIVRKLIMNIMNCLMKNIIWIHSFEMITPSFKGSPFLSLKSVYKEFSRLSVGV